MISDSPVPAVVPAGRMAGAEQPVFDLPNGLELRPWRLSDADALMAAARDPAIRRWNRLLVETPEEARRRIERMHERRRAELSVMWALARPGEEAVGLAGWGDIDLAGGSAEIVYWLLPAARGAGVAAEAAKRLGAWALDDLGLHRLRLCHSVANPASCRVADKAGYSLEGTMRSALLHADGWHDEHLHALVQGDV
ncbi:MULTISPECIES: GNAT family N-acetyltransferase [unclassified Streptomyces]|uniref:GNAT family N-acetyltransferase n=1 Tax=unclassified Streptomyces TaxID=2593676 RepID=UPI0006AE7702|nr:MULTISPECIES: GNAT family N-acetyltransferase [unclassified Streptomyces]KOX25646.1 acetyltransferase [Streptomyces sp. NRRL F-6491]KOX41432.1 acetyltransferase [Streptomyces sp. NRRL F-6492]